MTAVFTKDVDVVHRRTGDNAERIIAWCTEHKARFKYDLARRRLSPTTEMLLGTGHVNLVTDLGEVDFLRGHRGKRRKVPVFGVALDAARRWLERLPSWCPSNPHKLVFPTKTGCYRRVGRFLGRTYVEREARPGRTDRYVWEDRFQRLCRNAGLYRGAPKRPLVWHSLRHTCASALVSGYWGQTWPLIEVRDLLGHRSVTTTKRYAHLAGTALERAAEASRKEHAAALLALRPQGRPPNPSDRLPHLGSESRAIHGSCPSTILPRNS